MDFTACYDRPNAEIWRRLAGVEAQRRSIQQLPVPPKLAEQVNRLVVARTVHGTIAIEGSTLTEEEAQQIFSKEQVVLPSRDREVKEALAARKAHDYVRERWGKDHNLPINEADICEIHRLLTENIPYNDNIPGRYRHHAVQVGSPRHGGIYRPPEGFENIRRLMAEFVGWLNSRAVIEGEPGPIQGILAHYFLVLIHPFGDGNGRTARALESLILYRGGYNVKGFYSLANYYYRHRDDYFTLLQKTRTEYEGDQTRLLQFALQGLSEELQYVELLVVNGLKVILFQDFVRELVQRKVLNLRQSAILEFLSQKAESMPLETFRVHPLIAGLYEKRTVKTFLRDLRRMLDRKLLIALKNEQGKMTIKAHIELMDSFI